MGASKYNGALLHKSTDLNSESLGVRVPTGTIFWLGENADEEQNGMLHVTNTGEEPESEKGVDEPDLFGSRWISGKRGKIQWRFIT